MHTTPHIPVDMNESELFDLVSTMVKEAIADSLESRSRLEVSLAKLTEGGA